jgi:drug/metabolite transporter (DMT)-like permease
MRLSSPNTLFGRLLARLPIHVQLFINANVGLLLVASSQIFMVGMGLSAKYFVSTTEISTLTLIMVRMLITAACCIAWLAAEGKEEHIYLGPPEIRRLLVVRGITGFASLYAGFQSLRGLSVSDSTTIQFLAPNLTAALGFLVLGETLGWRDIVAGMTCLGGVLLISRPQFLFGVPAEVLEGAGGDAVNAAVSPEERALGVFWALIGVACSALSCESIPPLGSGRVEG